MGTKTIISLAALIPFGIFENSEALLFSAMIVAIALLVFYLKNKNKTVIAFDVGGVMTTGDYFTETVRSSEKMKQLVKTLRKKYKVVSLTNDNVIGYPAISKALGLDNVFEQQFISSAIGASKPDKRAFTFLLNKFELKPEELVFVDDKAENVESAKSMGIRAFQFSSLEKLVADLRATNIAI